MFPALALESVISSKIPGSFDWRMVLEIKIAAFCFILSIKKQNKPLKKKAAMKSSLEQGWNTGQQWRGEVTDLLIFLGWRTEIRNLSVEPWYKEWFVGIDPSPSHLSLHP